MPYSYALLLCLILMPYSYAIFLCHILMPYSYALFLCLNWCIICMIYLLYYYPIFNALFLFLILMPYLYSMILLLYVIFFRSTFCGCCFLRLSFCSVFVLHSWVLFISFMYYSHDFSFIYMCLSPLPCWRIGVRWLLDLGGHTGKCTKI